VNHSTTEAVPARLRALARQVQMIVPSQAQRADFYTRRDRVEAELRQIAAELEHR
jgi:hypothetical protein